MLKNSGSLYIIHIKKARNFADVRLQNSCKAYLRRKVGNFVHRKCNNAVSEIPSRRHDAEDRRCRRNLYGHAERYRRRIRRSVEGVLCNCPRHRRPILL